jgi:hypothetical protein
VRTDCDGAFDGVAGQMCRTQTEPNESSVTVDSRVDVGPIDDERSGFDRDRTPRADWRNRWTPGRDPAEQ